jgi:aminomethyltransferase
MFIFCGWETPLQFSGIMEEHRTVRASVGLFDLSHMGRLRISGPESLSVLEYLTTNRVSSMANHQVQYSVMCNPTGGIIDDLTIYRLSEEDFLLCVNACNREKDLYWIREYSRGEIQILDLTEELLQLALQGPNAEKVLMKVFGEKIHQLGYFWSGYFKLNSKNILISRTGYTGEDGFELYIPKDVVESVWLELLARGEEVGIKPIGLGARDTLRIEMKYCLYGNDISEQTTPLEAGLQWLIRWDQGDFIGRQSLDEQRQVGQYKKLIGFQLLERGVPRSRYQISSAGKFVGEVTSGIISPSLGRGIGMGYVVRDYSKIGTPLEIHMRNKIVRAEVVSTPFYPSKTKK